MNPKLPIAAITDEFSPDIEQAIPVMQEIGMGAAELRVVNGKNILDLTDAELDAALTRFEKRGIQIVSIASPLLKCVLPGAPPVESRWQQDVFASKHSFEDQGKLSERAFVVARRSGAQIVRVFSYWRTVQREKNTEAIVRALTDLAERASKHQLIIGLENEHACNIATAAEAMEIFERVSHPNLKLVWDPANAYIAGEAAFPEGYRKLPVDRIAHVHAKDCHLDNGKYEWGPLGTRDLDWKGQIAALLADGYRGYISLETHWAGPDGNKVEASRICGWNLRGLASA